MNIADYLDASNRGDKEFATALRVSGETVRRWRYGLTLPRPQTIDRIEKLTKGVVTLADCYAAYKAAHEKPPTPKQARKS